MRRLTVCTANLTPVVYYGAIQPVDLFLYLTCEELVAVFFMNDAKNTLRSRNSIAHVMVVDDAEDSVVNMFVDKLGTHYLHTCSNTSRSMLYLYA
jgi:hypothetical protein